MAGRINIQNMRQMISYGTPSHSVWLTLWLIFIVRQKCFPILRLTRSTDFHHQRGPSSDKCAIRGRSCQTWLNVSILLQCPACEMIVSGASALIRYWWSLYHVVYYGGPDCQFERTISLSDDQFSFLQIVLDMSGSPIECSPFSCSLKNRLQMFTYLKMDNPTVQQNSVKSLLCKEKAILRLKGHFHCLHWVAEVPNCFLSALELLFADWSAWEPLFSRQANNVNHQLIISSSLKAIRKGVLDD